MSVKDRAQAASLKYFNEGLPLPHVLLEFARTEIDLYIQDPDSYNEGLEVEPSESVIEVPNRIDKIIKEKYGI